MSTAVSASYRVLVAGSTGACGQAIVQELATAPKCREVLALCRRNVSFSRSDSSKVRLIVLEDFNDLVVEPERRRNKECPLWGLTEVDAAVCALGTTMKDAGGSQEAFRRVDHDYVCGFVKTAIGCGARRIALVSSSGASARSTFFYMRVKGETEDEVQRLCNEHGVALHVLRPAMLLTPPRTSGSRRLAENLAQRIVKTLRLSMGGSLAVSVAQVARTVRVALEEDPTTVVQAYGAQERASQSWVYPSRTIYRLGLGTA
ncbi:hypothetical protein CCYA_CCYA12G3332 [Cyanidiococcus yangmingshanensis]|nr:hypothetical protein CCYA_CCYA12G3332 [Cyanidiococcus yangmingshanensis]